MSLYLNGKNFLENRTMGEKMSLINFNRAVMFLLGILTFFGFYTILLLLFNYGFGDSSRLVTIPIRLLIAFLFIILFLVNIRYLKASLELRLFVVFSVVYIARLFFDFFNREMYYISSAEVLLYYLSFAVIPFVTITSLRMCNRYLESLFKALLLSGIIFSILSILFYSKFLGNVTRLTASNVGEDVISPLTLSYNSIMVIGVFLLYWINNSVGRIKRICLFFGIILSIVPFFLGASRGSLIALFLPLICYFYSGKSLKFIIRNSLLIALLLIAVIFFDGYFGSGLLTRFSDTSASFDNTDGGGDTRLLIWKSSFNQFIDNPFFGDKLRVDTWNGYPHNLILEVLQTTGVVGFFPFVYLLIGTINKSFYIFKKTPQYSWVPVIFLQSFLHNMVSGALYTAAWFWVSMGLVITTYYYLKKEDHDVKVKDI